jgi:hypothetical protein
LEFFHSTNSYQPRYGNGVNSAFDIGDYKDLFWGKGRPAPEADNLTAIYEPTV